MTNTTLGLLLITPFVWLFVSVLLYQRIVTEEEAAKKVGFIITIALWGIYLLLGGKL